ncbi:MAG: restriction endonuclease subunit S, partial [Treponema sp.]|nr:restriction endonuclease subunit S [Treponema sp.]
MARLQNIISLGSGKSIKVRQLEEGGKYPVYGGNGINGYYNDYNVNSDTIIIGRVGFYCGSIYLTSENAWVTDNALIVSIKSNVFIQGFFAEILRYLNLGKTSSSTAQPVVSGKGILPLIVPIPPKTEQKRVLEKYYEIVRLVDNLEESKKDLTSILNTVRTKILDLAIRGKLAPQDSNDEPASILLERIRAEKEELIKQGKLKRD